MATQVKESFPVSNPDQAWGVISDVNKLIPMRARREGPVG
jgi:hypothetical protein